MLTTVSEPTPADSYPSCEPGETYKAISLTQPWASLIMLNQKRMETRDWTTKHRGWLAIHAANGFPIDAQRICMERPFIKVLLDAGLVDGYDKSRTLDKIRHTMPLGMVLGFVYLADCVPVDDPIVVRRLNDNPYDAYFGNYAPGRKIMIFRYAPRPLPNPIQARGALGIWNWTVPEAT